MTNFTIRTQEAIQKILKSRKSVSRSNLVIELIDLLKSQFLPSKRLINEQIEFLIKQDYIGPDSNNPQTALIYKA